MELRVCIMIHKHNQIYKNGIKRMPGFARLIFIQSRLLKWRIAFLNILDVTSRSLEEMGFSLEGYQHQVI